MPSTCSKGVEQFQSTSYINTQSSKGHNHSNTKQVSDNTQLFARLLPETPVPSLYLSATTPDSNASWKEI